MASSRRFAVRLAVHVAMLVGLACLVARLSLLDEAPMAIALACVATAAVAASLWRMVDASNRELAGFVAALERSELAVSFRGERRGAGFGQLAAAYDRVVERLRADREGVAAGSRWAEALVDGAPTALLVLGPDEAVGFANAAARRLFGRAGAATLGDLAPFGTPLVEALRALAPGQARSTHLVAAGLSQRVALDATAVETAAGRRRIVSVRVIQQEVDEAELAAQGDLVRVLTHEVMNSLTPVTSLAGTAARLVGGFDPAWSPAVAKAQRAVAALARRADELERFVGDYRTFSAAPTLHRQPVDVATWFDELAGLFAAMPAAGGVAVAWPDVRTLGAVWIDRGLMTQVLLNLLKNAGEAVAGCADPAIAVEAGRDADRLRIAVADTGPGPAPGIARDAFLPFFTTKPKGSGIGLSFARGIVMAHGGRIAFADGPNGRIEVVLPLAP